MTNTEKLKNLMKEYGVEKCYYSHNMSLDNERPDGDIIFICDKNNKMELEVYKIFTEDGLLDEDQALDIYMLSENSESFNIHYKSNMEVLYANI